MAAETTYCGAIAAGAAEPRPSDRLPKSSLDEGWREYARAVHGRARFPLSRRRPAVYPRLINAICDNALLLTFSGGGRTVSMREVIEAVRDLNLKPPAAEISSDPPTLLPSGKHRSGPAIIRDLEAVTAANGGLE